MPISEAKNALKYTYDMIGLFILGYFHVIYSGLFAYNTICRTWYVWYVYQDTCN